LQRSSVCQRATPGKRFLINKRENKKKEKNNNKNKNKNQKKKKRDELKNIES